MCGWLKFTIKRLRSTHVQCCGYFSHRPQFIDYLALQPLVIELHGRLSAEKPSTPSGLTTSELMKQRNSRVNLALISNPGFKVVGVSQMLA